ncbi:hypothetical protein SLE2022_112160 [Rubroshorea leprosula]
MRSYFCDSATVIRLQKANSHINTIQALSFVMSLDFLKTVNEIHPSLINPAYGQSKSIANVSRQGSLGLDVIEPVIGVECFQSKQGERVGVQAAK